MRSMVVGAIGLAQPARGRVWRRAPSVSLRLPPPHEWGGSGGALLWPRQVAAAFPPRLPMAQTRACAKALRNDVQLSNVEILAGGAIVIVILLVGSWIIQSRSDRKAEALAAEEAAAAEAARKWRRLSMKIPIG